MELIKVIAHKGTKCPMENKPRKYIGSNVPVEVKNSLFYKRLIADGSLMKVENSTKKEVSIKEDKNYTIEKQKKNFKPKYIEKKVPENLPKKTFTKTVKNGGSS